MVAAAALVVVLAAIGDRFGPVVGGLSAALPVLASVLTVAVHRDRGGAAAVVFIRGTMAGMAGFVAFCALIGS